MKKIIIIGASSGIGAELAKVFSEKSWMVGIAARRLELLTELQKELPGPSQARQMDVANTEQARQQLQALISEMGGMDVIVLNAGIGDVKPHPDKELHLVQVNVAGFVALARFAFDHFAEKHAGHIVGLSSVASLRGTYMATAYSASKAFVSNYLEGLRVRSVKKNLNISVTDIRPGFVLTPMTEKNRNMFWVSSSRKAAEQMFDAIVEKKKVAYITKRWSLVARIFKALPDFIYYRM